MTIMATFTNTKRSVPVNCCLWSESLVWLIHHESCYTLKTFTGQGQEVIVTCGICALITCHLSHDQGWLWRPTELPEHCWCLGGSRHRQLWLRTQVQLPQEAHRLHTSQQLHRMDQLCKPLTHSLNHFSCVTSFRPVLLCADPALLS